jgi:ubiquinone/menaquinone biosynthesis C-methylase UbiE
MTGEIRDIVRVNRSKEDARAGYNRLSRWYDLVAGASERKYREAGLRALGAQPGEAVLEIGYGTGSSLIQLAQSVGDGGGVFGIDISDGMLARATARVRDAGVEGRVKLRRGDAASLPYGENVFDAIFICFTLELFDTPEMPVVLAECLRVLKAGGRMAVVSMSSYGRETRAVRLYKEAHRRFEKYVDCRPIYAKKALADAGFIIRDRSLMMMWGLPVEVVLAVKPEAGA